MQQNNLTFSSNIARQAVGDTFDAMKLLDKNDFDIDNKEVRKCLAYFWDDDVLNFISTYLRTCETKGIRFMDVPALKDYFITQLPIGIKQNVLHDGSAVNMGYMSDVLQDGKYKGNTGNKIKIYSKDEILVLLKDKLIATDAFIEVEGTVGSGKDVVTISVVMYLVEKLGWKLFFNSMWQKKLREPVDEFDDDIWSNENPPGVYKYYTICELLRGIFELRLERKKNGQPKYSTYHKPNIMVWWSELTAFLERLTPGSHEARVFRNLLQYMRKLKIRMITTSPKWIENSTIITGDKSRKSIASVRFIVSRDIPAEINRRYNTTYECQNYSGLVGIKFVKTADDRLRNDFTVDEMDYIFESFKGKYAKDLHEMKVGDIGYSDEAINRIEGIGTHYDGTPFDIGDFLSQFNEKMFHQYDKIAKEYFDCCGKTSSSTKFKKTQLEMDLEDLEKAIEIAPDAKTIFKLCPYKKFKDKWNESAFKTYVYRKFRKIRKKEKEAHV